MKAIRIHQHGDLNVLQLEDIPMPKPGKGQVLIRIKAAGLNFIDIYYRQGRRIPSTLPFTPGKEAAGIVEELGEGVTKAKIGERVAYCGPLGAYAEYSVVDENKLIPLPDDIGFEQGAAFPLQGMTAHYLVHDFYHIKPNDPVLVHAAAGGVGLLLVQWLKHMGARVIGTVSTEEKADIAKQAGADDIIFYTREDFVAEAKRLTNGVGVNYIIDGVGKTTFTKNLDAVKTYGWICIFGQASGPAEPLAPNSLQAKSLTICGGALDNAIATHAEIVRRSKDVLQGIREGWLHFKIDHAFPLAEAMNAQRALEERKTSGKVILTME